MAALSDEPLVGQAGEIATDLTWLVCRMDQPGQFYSGLGRLEVTVTLNMPGGICGFAEMKPDGTGSLLSKPRREFRY